MRIHSESDQKDQRVREFEEDDAKLDSYFLWGYIIGILFATITYCLATGFLNLFSD